MKQILLAALLAALLAFAVAGCSRVHIRGQDIGEDNVYFTRVEGRVFQSFQETDSAAFLFWGLVPIKQPNPAEKIRKYTSGKRKISNFRVITQYQVLDIGMSFSSHIPASGQVAAYRSASHAWCCSVWLAT